MNPTEKHSGAQHVLYDADQLEDADADLFEVQALAAAGRLRGTAQGRGTTHFVDIDGQPCVLRHYRRGGLVARLLGDRYLRTSLTETRAWREWHLLAELIEQGLPVPKPVAARVVTVGPFYRADLITRQLVDTRSLAQSLQQTALSEAQWRAIGATIRRFHDAGVYHADLNAHNILLDEKRSDKSNPVYVIDFDRGEKRCPSPGWQQANLARLRRSLDKLGAQQKTFHFDEAAWAALLAGWK
jgi:3-deoxy-D-manno-octulosonic acid kinase